MPETPKSTKPSPSTRDLTTPDDTPRSPSRPQQEDVQPHQLQLRALLAVTLDEQGCMLRIQSKEMRDSFLLACSVMGDEVRQLAQVLHTRLQAGHTA